MMPLQVSQGASTLPEVEIGLQECCGFTLVEDLSQSGTQLFGSICAN